MDDDPEWNREQQDNEILALQSIYETEFEIESSDPHVGILRINCELPFEGVHVRQRPADSTPELISRNPSQADQQSASPASDDAIATAHILHLPPVTVRFMMAKGYPSREPLILQVECPWLHARRQTGLCKTFRQFWDEDHDVILFRIAEFIKSELLESFGYLQKDENSTASEEVPVLEIEWPSPQHAREPFNNVLDQLIEYSQLQEQRIFDESVFSCGICLESKKGTACFRFSRCKHVFCKGCLEDFFSAMITEGSVSCVGCPDPECTKLDSKNHELTSAGRLPVADVQRIVNKTLSKRYTEIIRKKILESRNDVTYCPRQDCGAPVIRESMDDKLCVCKECGFAFCCFCRKCWHGYQSYCKLSNLDTILEQYLKADDSAKALLEKRYGKKMLLKLVKEMEDEKESELWKKNNTQKCPECCISVIKSEGCNKMTCHICKTFFCYICGSFLSRDAPYWHFNDSNSGCYQRLFDAPEDDETIQNRARNAEDGEAVEPWWGANAAPDEQAEWFPNEEVINLVLGEGHGE
ncbi:uncharacterized protein BJ171DRAFT_519976 [Polychytrium aggregatum]|uniref:uncharacterized protein n=1 Tax=Polychytrium aggregatum TaxID=110093 RepID=UPI0022FEED05|nr:uncharacterized protein BJ171DRAFT_519976 [Polychytrium aggregatum]KAI9197338.1 hypothetical protein BJ171DRAFT_519976 [Polychytrium aggregatum]